MDFQTPLTEDEILDFLQNL